MKPRARDPRAGFTLMELVVIITIAGVVMTPILISFAETSVSAMETTKVHMAVFLAQDLMEEVRTRKFDEDTPGTGGVVDNGDINIGLDTGENAAGPRSGWDDVDDFNGWSISPPKDMNGNSLTDFTGYTTGVTVEYVASADFDTVVAGPTDYKRVTVTVSWQGGTRSVRLRLVVANF